MRTRKGTSRKRGKGGDSDQVERVESGYVFHWCAAVMVWGVWVMVVPKRSRNAAQRSDKGGAQQRSHTHVMFPCGCFPLSFLCCDGVDSEQMDASSTSIPLDDS
jgi:hypothetical protein